MRSLVYASNMTSSGNSTPYLLILSPTAYLPGHMLRLRLQKIVKMSFGARYVKHCEHYHLSFSGKRTYFICTFSAFYCHSDNKVASGNSVPSNMLVKIEEDCEKT